MGIPSRVHSDRLFSQVASCIKRIMLSCQPFLSLIDSQANFSSLKCKNDHQAYHGFQLQQMQSIVIPRHASWMGTKTRPGSASLRGVSPAMRGAIRQHVPRLRVAKAELTDAPGKTSC